jgi:hypothetical protein
MKATFEDGRQAMFQEMMAQLTQLQSKYKGVRGELLAKVREELERCKPGSENENPAPKVAEREIAAREIAAPVTVVPEIAAPPIRVAAIRVASASADKMLPSCRKCGRTMRLNDADGGLICDKGHTRPPMTAQAEGAAASL